MLDELLQDVVEKKRMCEAKQWKYTKRNGEVVFIRESLDQVVEWAKRFREVGDAAAQYDPTTCGAAMGRFQAPPSGMSTIPAFDTPAH